MNELDYKEEIDKLYSEQRTHMNKMTTLADIQTSEMLTSAARDKVRLICTYIEVLALVAIAIELGLKL